MIHCRLSFHEQFRERTALISKEPETGAQQHRACHSLQLHANRRALLQTMRRESLFKAGYVHIAQCVRNASVKDWNGTHSCSQTVHIASWHLQMVIVASTVLSIHIAALYQHIQMFQLLI